MTKEIITAKVLSCTPRELQRVIDTIHGWAKDFGDEMAKEVKTMQDIVELLSRSEYIQEAEAVEDQTGENYFKVVFGV